MIRWEYQVHCFDVPEEGIDQRKHEEWLNLQGEQGWDLVGTECVARVIRGLVGPRYQLVITFKRPCS
jgi:hypothetical protein